MSTESRTTDTEPLSDAEKLRALAAWFDLYDSDPSTAMRLFRVSVNESRASDEVQRDLRRIADYIEGRR